MAQKMDVRCEVTVREFIRAWRRAFKKCNPRFKIRGYKLKTNSLRYQCFNELSACVNCGIKGSHVNIELAMDTGQTRPHANMYAYNECGHPILLTKDHIVPKSEGGSDLMSNLITMCSKCNQLKSSNKISKALMRKINKIKERSRKCSR